MRTHFVLGLLGLLAAGHASADCGPSQWTFDMTPEDVAGVTKCGPYKTFTNGDLETYRGVFDGKAENFQFFFADGKLRRIGIYIYEGQDPVAGSDAWLKLHDTLTRLFGSIEAPGNVDPSSGSRGREAFVTKALKDVRGPGKSQMAPLLQPRDAQVFSSFMRREVDGVKHYYVVVYFDRID